MKIGRDFDIPAFINDKECIEMSKQRFFTYLYDQVAILWPALNAHRGNAEGKKLEELNGLCGDWERLTDKLRKLKIAA